jgi:hypothetical protein
VYSDLEDIVSADEEARARVALAERHRDREIAQARAAHDAAVAAREKAAAEELERQLNQIRDQSEARVAELAAQQKKYLQGLADAGAKNLEEAVALYTRIVCEVTS